MANPLLLPQLILTLSLSPPPFLHPLIVKHPSIEHFGGFIFHKDPKDRKTQYLLMKHAKHDDWDLPGGQLEPNETVIQAALRETFEETGWLLYRDYQADFRSEIYFEYKKANGVWRHVHLWPAVLTNTDKNLTISEEHTDYKWMDFDEAEKIIKSPYKNAFTRAHYGIIRTHQWYGLHRDADEEYDSKEST